MKQDVQAYQTASTLGDTQLELIIKVYNGVMIALDTATEAFSKNQGLEAREQLAKAEKGVAHLFTTLDFEQGGEIAHSLGQLYVFAINRIQSASSSGQTAPISEARRVLDNLRTAWTELRGTHSVTARVVEPSAVAVNFAG